MLKRYSLQPNHWPMLNVFQFVTQTIVSMTLEPGQQKPRFQHGELRHRLILVLGTLIRRLNTQGARERASQLAPRLQDMLGVHGEWEGINVPQRRNRLPSHLSSSSSSSSPPVVSPPRSRSSSLRASPFYFHAFMIIKFFYICIICIIVLVVLSVSLYSQEIHYLFSVNVCNWSSVQLRNETLTTKMTDENNSFIIIISFIIVTRLINKFLDFDVLSTTSGHLRTPLW